MASENYNDLARAFFKRNRIPDSFEGEKITIGITATALTFSNAINRLRIQADGVNTGVIYVGDSTVLYDGTGAMAKLEPGQIFETGYDGEGSSIYIVASEAGQIVYQWAGYVA